MLEATFQWTSRKEHLTNLKKELLKHLGVNITEKPAKCCSKAIGHVDHLIPSVDNDLNVNRPSGHHKVQKHDPNFRLFVNQFHQ